MPEQKIPAWLDAAVDQRITQLQEVMPLPVLALVSGANVIFVYLTEPGENPTPDQYEAWQHTCDNCGKVDPGLRTGHMSRLVEGVVVTIGMGACASCLDAP